MHLKRHVSSRDQRRPALRSGCQGLFCAFRSERFSCSLAFARLLRKEVECAELRDDPYSAEKISPAFSASKQNAEICKLLFFIFYFFVCF